jgi:hypothetical protein
MKLMQAAVKAATGAWGMNFGVQVGMDFMHNVVKIKFGGVSLMVIVLYDAGGRSWPLCFSIHIGETERAYTHCLSNIRAAIWQFHGHVLLLHYAVLDNNPAGQNAYLNSEPAWREEAQEILLAEAGATADTGGGRAAEAHVGESQLASAGVAGHVRFETGPHLRNCHTHSESKLASNAGGSGWGFSAEEQAEIAAIIRRLRKVTVRHVHAAMLRALFDEQCASEDRSTRAEFWRANYPSYFMDPRHQSSSSGGPPIYPSHNQGSARK